jgi:hypothetical protein
MWKNARKASLMENMVNQNIGMKALLYPLNSKIAAMSAWVIMNVPA